MYGDAADVLVVKFDLSRMEACADLDAQRSHSVGSGDRAAHGSRRTVERREEPVSGRAALPPAEAPQFTGG